jgi:hypothetical protein
MTQAHDFVVDLAHAGQDAKTIFKLCKDAHGDQGLSLSQVNRILAVIKGGGEPSDK